ncbi:hypothetical protein FOZ62_012936, partial [Perkinsus olseni]
GRGDESGKVCRSELHARVLHILDSIIDETAFLRPPTNDFTSENLAEKTRYSLGWCQAHEAFREHIIDSPHRFLDILDHLSELCQLLDVPTTERSACRSSGMESLGALISLLVQQRFNATSMPLQ